MADSNCCLVCLYDDSSLVVMGSGEMKQWQNDRGCDEKLDAAD